MKNILNKLPQSLKQPVEYHKLDFMPQGSESLQAQPSTSSEWMTSLKVVKVFSC
jgi:hypothetical protein